MQLTDVIEVGQAMGLSTLAVSETEAQLDRVIVTLTPVGAVVEAPGLKPTKPTMLRHVLALRVSEALLALKN